MLLRTRVAANASMRLSPTSRQHDSFCSAIHFIIGDAPRGRDTGDLEEAIGDAQNIEDTCGDEMRELLELAIKDRSRAARERLKLVETQMEEARDKAAELNKRLDSMTSVSVMRKLDSLRDVLSQSTINVAEANRVLKQAIRKMVLNPARGEIDIYWNHTDEPQRAGRDRHEPWSLRAVAPEEAQVRTPTSIQDTNVGRGDIRT